MNSDQAQEISERDQLWASLRVLRSAIDGLANGQFDPTSEPQKQLVQLISRIVAAEMDFRERTPGT